MNPSHEAPNQGLGFWRFVPQILRGFGRPPVVEMLSGLAARIPSSDAQNMALKRLFLFTRQQGNLMAFTDVFLLLRLPFAVFAPLVRLMRRPPPVTAAVDAH